MAKTISLLLPQEHKIHTFIPRHHRLLFRLLYDQKLQKETYSKNKTLYYIQQAQDYIPQARKTCKPVHILQDLKTI